MQADCANHSLKSPPCFLQSLMRWNANSNITINPNIMPLLMVTSQLFIFIKNYVLFLIVDHY